MTKDLFTPGGLFRAMTGADLAVSVVLLLAAFAAPRVFGSADGDELRAVVTVGRREVAVIPLAADGETVVRGRIGEVRLRVAAGAVSVAASTCPQKVCIASGAKARPGEVIACVPNGLLVRVAGGPPDPGVPDAVTR